MLKKLDEAAKLVKKRVVVVVDEFQQLSEITDHAVEATIRHAMQYSSHVSYIFSGSYRHMLLGMFNDKNRPFYNSCEVMQIDRIEEGDYIAFIQKAAQEKWKKKIEDKALEKIFEVTEYHPSYINRICGYFWLIGEIPKYDTVIAYWNDFVLSKKGEFSESLLRLSKNKKK